MNTYYLVPTSEYGKTAVDAGDSKQKIFDNVTKQILETPHLSEEERVAELRDSLSKYLNYRTAFNAHYEEDFGKFMKQLATKFAEASADTPNQKEVMEPTQKVIPETPQKPPKQIRIKKSTPFVGTEAALDTDSVNETDGVDTFLDTPRMKTLTKSHPKINWASDLMQENVLPETDKRVRKPPKQHGEGKRKKQAGGWAAQI